MPPFEFYRSANLINHNKLFIRDFNQSWYQSGLAGHSTNIRSTRDFLENQIQKISPKKILFVGNSMGGFAAILFALLLARGDVVAFAPQSYISPHLKLYYNDFRWLKELCRVYVRSYSEREFWDLKPLLKLATPNQKISIYCASNHTLDRKHASRLSGSSNVETNFLTVGGHGIVRTLRDNGMLPEILRMD